MISEKEKKELLKRIRKGDYTTASTIYQSENGFTITPRNLQYFLTIQSSSPGKWRHDPRNKYRAILGAVIRRERETRELNQVARKMRVSMIGK